MLNNWNRIYGNNGFTQYQFVIPFERGREGLIEIMKEITESGCGTFLVFLTTFGDKDDFSSFLNFPDGGHIHTGFGFQNFTQSFFTIR